MKKSKEQNPFVDFDFNIPIKQWVIVSTIRGSNQSENASSEVTSQQRDSKYLDVAKNARVFKSKELFGQFLQLSGPTKDLFMYLLLKLPENQDYLEFKDETFAELMGKAVRTVREWRGELQWFIKPRKGRKNMYWINPAIVFNGNRVNYFPSFHRSKVDNKAIERENEYVSQ